jgi:vitamin B12 transporter
MKRFIILTIFFLLIPVVGFSQDSEENKKEKKMDDVVVTATKTNASKDKVGGNTVIVITADEIEAKKMTTVSDVLKSVPGISIAANGGYGTSTSIFMRGADSKNVLVLVDGVMFNDPSNANRNANIGSLTLDNIERIEIVKGSQSVLYGSNATAGVINIITKSGKRKPNVYLGFEYGSYNTSKIYAGTSGRTDKIAYSLDISKNKSDGYSIANDDNEEIPHNGKTDEDDGWENTNISASLKLFISKDSDLSFNIRSINSEFDTDNWNYSGYAEDNEETNKYEGTFIKCNLHNLFFHKSFESTLSLQASENIRNMYDGTGSEKSTSPYKGGTKELSWQGNWFYDDISTLSFGFNLFTEDYDNKSIAKNIYTNSYFLQEQITVNGFDVVLGFRNDNHENFGNYTTYRIAPAYLIQSSGTKLKASLGTGFRSPSAFELYSSYGNENLNPEKSNTWDCGFEQSLINEDLLLSITYFDMIFKDRIGYSSTTSKYEQIDGKTKTKGIELGADFSATDNLNLMFSYTYTDTKDPDKESLVRRPYHKYTFNSNYKYSKKGSINLDIVYAGRRSASSYAKDSNGDSVDYLDPYVVVNFAGEYKITKNANVYVRVDNLFDEKYETCWSYATPGLSAYIGFKIEI